MQWAKLTQASVNKEQSNPLVYDFYNFPKHFYDAQFHSQGSPEMLEAVKSALKAGEVGFTEEKRGLDHGVWGECPSSVSSSRPWSFFALVS
jgi:aromatic ring-opening dioxygenase catalytic subunit (LigB family)